MIAWFRYVPHALKPAYQSLGWRDCGPAPGHHAIYSHVMRFDGEARPPEPMPGINAEETE